MLRVDQEKGLDVYGVLFAIIVNLYRTKVTFAVTQVKV
jgi:hypothetical protein